MQLVRRSSLSDDSYSKSGRYRYQELSTIFGRFLLAVEYTRPFVTFRNKLIFYVELEDHPMSAVRDCLFSIFAAALHTLGPSPPSAT
jgi:hypothetical protein